MEYVLVGLLGVSATIITGLLSLCGVMYRQRRNHASAPGNPGVQPCMEGGNLLGEFRLLAEAFRDDTREMRGKLDELIRIVGGIESRIPRP